MHNLRQPAGLYYPGVGGKVSRGHRGVKPELDTGAPLSGIVGMGLTSPEVPAEWWGRGHRPVSHLLEKDPVVCVDSEVRFSSYLRWALS